MRRRNIIATALTVLVFGLIAVTYKAPPPPSPLSAEDLQMQLDELWAKSDWRGFIRLAEQQEQFGLMSEQQQQALAVAKVNIATPTPSPQPSRFVGRGQEGTINADGAWLAVSKSSYDAMNKAALAKDTIGLSNLAAAGLLFRSPRGRESSSLTLMESLTQCFRFGSWKGQPLAIAAGC